MGQCCSIQVSCDSLINRCWECSAGRATSICQVEDNLEELKTTIGELQALKSDVMRRVHNEEGPEMKRLEKVQWWLSRVDTTLNEADKVIGDGPEEIEKLCLGGCCSKNYKSTYVFAKRVAHRLRNVIALKDQGDFKVVAERTLPEPIVERPSEPTTGLETVLIKVWDCLMEEQVGIIGLYGMGGVGKTTLLIEINNKFLHTQSDFDIVIWVSVSHNMELEDIQEEIWKKLGCPGKPPDKQWKTKKFGKIAEILLHVLRKKKFVLLLDDLWERVNLAEIGVPLPDSHSGSRIVFTTRSEEVCSQMDAQKRVKVEPLPWLRAWELFERKVGEDTLGAHPDISQLAQDVARECGGLPLALVTVARAMSCKRTPQEWSHALEVLRKSASNLQGMRDQVFPLLKFSYDNLPNDRLRACFLCCALFPKDFRLLKDELVEYWICEKFWDEYGSEVGALNEAYDILGTLVRACLLEEEDEYVSMHDVIRDMALWIACRVNKEKESFMVQMGSQLKEAPEVGIWGGVRRMSLTDTSIECLSAAPLSPDLVTLFLSRNECLIRICSNFFQFMEALTVLDLSYSGIDELPLGVSNLVSLQYLNLSHTWMKQLRPEIRMLVKLKYLNLEHNSSLCVIPGGVISNLSSLQVLRMLSCGFTYDEKEDNILVANSAKHVEEVQCLRDLQVMSISIRCASALKRLFNNSRLCNSTRVLSLELFYGSKALNISLLASMKQLQKLQIRECLFLEELLVEPVITRMGGQASSSHHNSDFSRNRCFNSLTEVTVADCIRLKDLTWLVLAPNVTVLRVQNCQNMDKIISIEKTGEIQIASLDIKPFAKLEVLELSGLPKLTCIYENSLSFPLLKDSKLTSCPMLEAHPENTAAAAAATTTT